MSGTPRVSFLPGREPTPGFLNRIQDPVKYTGQSRIDYWNPNELRASWGINERDKIKDYEIDSNSSLAATAYYGLIKGASVDPTTGLRLEAIVGRPRSYVTPDTIPGFANIEVYGGSIVSVNGFIAEWEDVELTITADGEVYGYVDISGTVITDSTLPPNTSIFTPLFRLVMAGGSISTYEDLRPNSHLNYIPDNYFVLLNTPVISDDYEASSWERVQCDTSIYSFRVVLPQTPTNSDRVAITDVRGIASAQPIIVSGDVLNINGSTANYIINSDFGHVVFFFSEEENSWFVESTNSLDSNNNNNNLFPIDYKEVDVDYTIQSEDYRTWIDFDSSLSSRIVTLPGNLEYGFEFFLQSMGGTTVLISAENIELNNLSVADGESVRLIWLDDTNFGGSGVWKGIQSGGSGGGTVTVTADPFPKSNEEILTGTKTLATGDPQIQVLNPNGAAKDVILPVPPDTDDYFVIINDSDGLSASGNTLNIKETSGGSVILSLDDTSGQMNVRCIYTGNKWVIYD